MAAQDDVFGMTDDSVNGKKGPSRKIIDWFHQQVSTQNDSDVHHPLGFGPGEASRGDHTHDGKNSKPLWGDDVELHDVTVSSTAAQIADAINAINAALRQKGAV